MSGDKGKPAKVVSTTAVPNKKVVYGAAGGALGGGAIVFVWGYIAPDYPMPQEVAAGLALFVGFIVSYFTSPSHKGILRDDTKQV